MTAADCWKSSHAACDLRYPNIKRAITARGAGSTGAAAPASLNGRGCTETEKCPSELLAMQLKSRMTDRGLIGLQYFVDVLSRLQVNVMSAFISLM